MPCGHLLLITRVPESALGKAQIRTYVRNMPCGHLLTHHSSSFSYGLHGGLKMFPSERVSVHLELDYTRFEPDTDSDETITIDTMSLFVGASFYF